MYKLCKWIYDLAWERGYQEGRDSVYAELERDKIMEQFTKEFTEASAK